MKDKIKIFQMHKYSVEIITLYSILYNYSLIGRRNTLEKVAIKKWTWIYLFSVLLIFPEQPLPGDLYLFLNGHFVKYKTKDDNISQQNLNSLFYKRSNMSLSLKTMLLPTNHGPNASQAK